jgi:GTPase SAR1 family protein
MEDLSETTSEQTCVLLVGNKKDLEQKREVTHE